MLDVASDYASDCVAVCGHSSRSIPVTELSHELPPDRGSSVIFQVKKN